MKKILIGIFVITLIGVLILGGVFLYKRYVNNNMNNNGDNNKIKTNTSDKQKIALEDLFEKVKIEDIKYNLVNGNNYTFAEKYKLSKEDLDKIAEDEKRKEVDIQIDPNSIPEGSTYEKEYEKAKKMLVKVLKDDKDNKLTLYNSEGSGIEKQEIFSIDANIVLDKEVGNIIFIRGGKIEANVFQLRKKVQSIMDVTNTMREFCNVCTKFLKIKENTEPESRLLYNSDKVKEGESIQEGIYKDGAQCCITYKVNDKKYDLNFYMVGEELIYEFVKIL